VRVGSEKYAKAGFFLGAGTGNICRRCVAVGVESSFNGAGYQWPESANQKPNVWLFQECVAHNNLANGIFVWQNDLHPHVVERFSGYHNGQSGIFHGAYLNHYLYQDILLYANGGSGVELHANSGSTQSTPQRWNRVAIDQAGLSDYAIHVKLHNLPATEPTVVEGCELRGYLRAGIGVDDVDGDPSRLEVRDDVVFGGNEFWMADDCAADSEIRWGGLTIRRKDQAGTPRPEWNASVS
jgi:hypothetical protein